VGVTVAVAVGSTAVGVTVAVEVVSTAVGATVVVEVVSTAVGVTVVVNVSTFDGVRVGLIEALGVVLAWLIISTVVSPLQAEIALAAIIAALIPFNFIWVI
jgi:hypothetical protein